MRKIDTIVLHHSATASKAYEADLDGSMMSKNICASHYRNWVEKFPDYVCDYHFLIGPTGTVFKEQPLEQAGWHCGNYEMNLKSIGICFLGNFEKNIMPEKQMLAGAELINDLRIRFGIDKVLQHKDVVPTLCPGKLFPYAKMMSEVGIDKEVEDEMTESKEAFKFALDNKIIQPQFLTQVFLEQYLKEELTMERLLIILYRFKKLLEPKICREGSGKNYTIS